MIDVMKIGVMAGVMVASSGGIVHAQPTTPTKVETRFDRYCDYEQTTKMLRDIAGAYPELVTLRSIGKSLQGREVWLVIVNAEKTGPHEHKPAMYIDGSIHGNEIQATEVVLYTLHELVSSYGHNAKLTELLDRCAFYLVPLVNPDGRSFWFTQATNPHMGRHNIRPVDNDLDGQTDEDPSDDLDGDGQITQMWKEDPAGRWVRSQTDERVFVRMRDDQNAAAGVKTYVNLGQEGIDNDRDGQINEDGPLADDMNRNWPTDWQPTHIQGGAGPYPLSAPETRGIAEFVLGRPNIMAAQSYHNTGGMILRGPGAAYREGVYAPEDVRVYDELQRVGEQMLPYYRAMVLHRDLYKVHGGELNWFAEGLGAFSFTNELWTASKYFQREGRDPNEEQQWLWRDRMAFGELYAPLKEMEHPQFGRVLVGGLNKWSSRVTPTFMLEEECHRNFAFTMYHADQMPKMEFGRVEVVARGPGLWEITAEVRNVRLMPTRSVIQQRGRIGGPDLVTAEGLSGARVVAAARLGSWNDLHAQPVAREPGRVQLADGVPGRGARIVRWFVEGTAGASVRVGFAGERAGRIERVVELKAASKE
ncbi:MAG: hypothetical protein K2W85_07775 [Phycisphaerales bacterium]|nr:hypothetical protein [Phycisphaerales bacterium]